MIWILGIEWVFIYVFCVIHVLCISVRFHKAKGLFMIIKNSPKMLFLGIKDTYSKGGSYNFLKEKHRLIPSLIVEDILKNFQ